MTTPNQHHQEEHAHFLTPLPVYFRTFAALIFLTILTVIVSYFDFGTFNLLVAMLIAVIKGALVVYFFMQLRAENIGNKVTFFSAFVFLALFLLITAADIFFRQPEEPVRIEQNAAAAAGPVDVNKLIKSTPEAIEEGKKLFAQNCVTCHGPQGYGNGIAAAALNPKPRNFHATVGWVNGRAVSRIVYTISHGVEGSAMASFAGLSYEQRFALAHYVRTFMTDPPADTPTDIKALGLGDVSNKKENPPIPVDVAMDHMAIPDSVVIPDEAPVDANSQGEQIFARDCVQCHGINGRGAIVKSIGQAPPVEYITASFSGSQKDWTKSQAAFTKFVSEGVVGNEMPGFGTYSKEEWASLYNYVRKLVALPSNNNMTTSNE